ncbi:MAG TPA: hypothetical protein VNO21_09045 [Polyangiaceae bacterium]|nr:hypothetical protein [Polyangiaceae bacterium]
MNWHIDLRRLGPQTPTEETKVREEGKAEFCWNDALGPLARERFVARAPDSKRTGIPARELRVTQAIGHCMNSDIVAGYYAWEVIDGHARRLLAQLQPVAEQLESLHSRHLGASKVIVDALWSAFTRVERRGSALAWAISKQLRGTETSSLDIALRHTIPAFERYTHRRGVTVDVASISGRIYVAIEPRSLRIGIERVFETLLRFARPGETIAITYERRGRWDVLQIELATRGEPLDSAVVEGDLSSLRRWMEMRLGRLDVVKKSESVSVVLALPAHLIHEEESDGQG